MPLKTTVIGSYPKPPYLEVPDWFKSQQREDGSYYSPEEYNSFLHGIDRKELNHLEDKAIGEVVKEQENMGLSVITDGEMARENYIYHFCRRVKGFDFSNLTTTTIRNGAALAVAPAIAEKLEPLHSVPWCVEEWRKAQAMTDVPVKMTLPGPMTIIDTTHNKFYEDRKELSLDLIKCLNREIKALEEAGCKYIQLDEPIFARKPQLALEYGIENAAQCFQNVGNDIYKTVHLCCGYPNYLDEKDYVKADRKSYLMLAAALDAAGFDAVSIEDAHRHNDLSLFEKFKKTTVILGVVAVAQSRVETPGEIRHRVEEVLQCIPSERLWLAPDCGLGFLPPDILKSKVKNMVQVAKEL